VSGQGHDLPYSPCMSTASYGWPHWKEQVIRTVLFCQLGMLYR